jgi:septum formation protein
MKRGLAGKVGPAGLAKALAVAKAEAISAEVSGSLVIGADQVLALEDVLLDKPKDLAGARAQLERLRGRTHRLFTAVALAKDGRTVWQTGDSAALTMRQFSDKFLDAYLSHSGESLCRMVGAYELEGRGVQLFERVEGDHFTIIGLPLVALLAELRDRGVLLA